MRVSMAVLVMALVIARPAVAQSTDESDLAARMIALPPEYAADRLLVLSARANDAALRGELLGRAFEIAGASRAPYPVNSLARMDSVANRRAASSAALNRLSLRARAIRMVLDRDPRLAREWFQRLDLSYPALPCRETDIPDLSDYFRLAATIAQRFPPDEKAEGQDLVFVRSVLNAVPSSTGLDGAVLLVRDAGWLRREPSAARLVYTDLAQLFRGVALEPLAAERIVLLAEILAPLVRQSEAAAILVPAFQDYLRRIAAAKVCRAHIGWPSKSLVTHLKRVVCPSDHDCLRLDEGTGEKGQRRWEPGPDASAQGLFWTDPVSASLLRDVRSLPTPEAKARSASDRIEPLVERIEGLADGSDATTSALERLTLLRVLRRHASTDRMRHRIEEAFLTQLNKLDDGTKPTLWFLYASDVLALSSQQASVPTVFGPYVTSDPVLSMYQPDAASHMRRIWDLFVSNARP